MALSLARVLILAYWQCRVVTIIPEVATTHAATLGLASKQNGIVLAKAGKLNVGVEGVEKRLVGVGQATVRPVGRVIALIVAEALRSVWLSIREMMEPPTRDT